MQILSVLLPKIRRNYVSIGRSCPALMSSIHIV
ncbi:MAG: hypothetical protein ACI9KM_001377, partial [Rubritalea sp.]